MSKVGLSYLFGSAAPSKEEEDEVEVGGGTNERKEEGMKRPKVFA